MSASLTPAEYVTQTAKESATAREAFVRQNTDLLVKASQAMGKSLAEGGKVLILGNGGSAADAQHMAAEMVGRMLIDRRPLPAIALTTDSSNLTAIGNDFGFETVFVKQVQALARRGDIVIAISTSGNSANVLAAVDAANQQGCVTIGLTGGSGGKLKERCQITLNVGEGKNSSRIQESHLFAVHSLVDLLDRFFLPAG